MTVLLVSSIAAQALFRFFSDCPPKNCVLKIVIYLRFCFNAFSFYFKKNGNHIQVAAFHSHILQPVDFQLSVLLFKRTGFLPCSCKLEQLFFGKVRPHELHAGREAFFIHTHRDG